MGSRRGNTHGVGQLGVRGAVPEQKECSLRIRHLGKGIQTSLGPVNAGGHAMLVAKGQAPNGRTKKLKLARTAHKAGRQGTEVRAAGSIREDNFGIGGLEDEPGQDRHSTQRLQSLAHLSRATS